MSSLFSSHLFVLQKSSHVFVLQKSVMNSMVNRDVETKSTYYESGQHAKRSESSNRQTVYNLGPIIEERNWNMLSQLIRLTGKYTGDSRERDDAGVLHGGNMFKHEQLWRTGLVRDLFAFKHLMIFAINP